MPISRPRRSTRAELLDAPDVEPVALAENLRDLRSIGRLLGSTAQCLRVLRPWLRQLPPGAPVSLLDIATGGGDGAALLGCAVRRAGYRVQLIGSDRLAAALQYAALAHPQLHLLRHVAPALPLADQAVDIAVLQLALHHFEPAEAPALLREMTRVARRGVVVVDLQRSWAGYLGARLLSHGPWGELARHDGPLSALRAYTPAEVRQLAAVAGMVGAQVMAAGPLLLTLSYSVGGSGRGVPANAYSST
ncbi:MAG TPA: methyltransferase domain-containing protein, partial [Roseiflexaceae bacterium]|nr:methyltransferase domain-containing protein [Roseiflexaceae bacterium]